MRMRLAFVVYQMFALADPGMEPQEPIVYQAKYEEKQIESRMWADPLHPRLPRTAPAKARATPAALDTHDTVASALVLRKHVGTGFKCSRSYALLSLVSPVRESSTSCMRRTPALSIHRGACAAPGSESEDKVCWRCGTTTSAAEAVSAQLSTTP